MFGILKKVVTPTNPTTPLELDPIDQLLATSLSEDNQVCDALLDLKLGLKKREYASNCVETFFMLWGIVEDSRQCMLMEQLRLILMTHICVEANKPESGEVTYHRVDFKADNFLCFVRRFICRYHGVTCCRQCPGNTLFRVVFVSELEHAL